MNRAAADLGIASFADIATHADALEGKIYGIEPGNDGNRLIMDMIAADAFGLGGFDVAESSEQGMLAQVTRADRRGEPIVFLGWEPHPDERQFRHDLSGRRRRLVRPQSGRRRGVHQHARGLCRRMSQSSARFFGNLEFTLAMENEIMGAILDDGTDPAEAATTWLTANPDVLDGWLAGVTTRDGAEALPAARAALGL